MVHAFAPHPWLPLPMVVILLFMTLYSFRVLATGRYFPLIINEFDLVLILFVASLVLSTLINIGDVGPKQISHLMSYIGIAGAYYFGAKLLITASRVTYHEMVRWLTASLLIAALFGLVEFAGKNFFDFNVDLIVPRPDGETFSSTFAGQFVRARSFMSESANFASFLDILTPIVITHWWSKGYKLGCFLILAVVIPAFISTFSAAAIGAVIAGICLANMLYIPQLLLARSRVRSILFPATLTGGIIAVPMILFANRESVWAQGIMDKLLFLDPGSAADRLQRWQGALLLVRENPLIGSGAGAFLLSTNLESGIVSWPIQILAEGGLMAGAIFVFLFVLLLARVTRLPRSRKYAYAMALGAVAVHYSLISDYWMPWIWLLPLLIYHRFQLEAQTEIPFYGPQVKSPGPARAATGIIES